jgi:hypothetical protein
MRKTIEVGGAQFLKKAFSGWPAPMTIVKPSLRPGRRSVA